MRIAMLLWVPALVLGGSLPALLAAAPATKPCLCRHAGGAVEQGETVCLVRDGQHQLARCEMVLNTTSWRFLGQTCAPVASTSRPPARSEG